MANTYTVGRITQLTQRRGDDGLEAAVNRVACAIDRHAELVAIEQRIGKGKRGRPRRMPTLHELEAAMGLTPLPADALPKRRGHPPKA